MFYKVLNKLFSWSSSSNFYAAVLLKHIDGICITPPPHRYNYVIEIRKEALKMKKDFKQNKICLNGSLQMMRGREEGDVPGEFIVFYFMFLNFNLLHFYYINLFINAWLLIRRRILSNQNKNLRFSTHSIT